MFTVLCVAKEKHVPQKIVYMTLLQNHTYLPFFEHTTYSWDTVFFLLLSHFCSSCCAKPMAIINLGCGRGNYPGTTLLETPY
jgi:hypothetical protein